MSSMCRGTALIAAEAWGKARSGKADASKFGIIHGNQRGLWFIATDPVHDLAALNKVETLPWDVWGATPKPDEQLQGQALELFEHIAALTRKPDTTFAELRQFHEEDERVRVPARVFNALVQRVEAI